MLPPLITQSGNPKIQHASAGYLDASQFAEILEKPSGVVSRAMGDVHPLGNPHYWLDPENGERVVRYASRIPVPLTADLLALGRKRYDITCGTCHGPLGADRTLPALGAKP